MPPIENPRPGPRLKKLIKPVVFLNSFGAPWTRIFEIWRKYLKKGSKKEAPGMAKNLNIQQILLVFTEKRSIEKVKKKHACHYSRSENISAILVPFAYARVPLFGHFWAPLCDKEIARMAKIIKKEWAL